MSHVARCEYVLGPAVAQSDRRRRAVTRKDSSEQTVRREISQVGQEEERERQEETKRDLRQTKQWTTSTNRATQQATASKKESQTFSQIRPHMSVFFCTASSRPSLGRRLRRRLGGRITNLGSYLLRAVSSTRSLRAFDQMPDRPVIWIDPKSRIPGSTPGPTPRRHILVLWRTIRPTYPYSLRSRGAKAEVPEPSAFEKVNSKGS